MHMSHIITEGRMDQHYRISITKPHRKVMNISKGTKFSIESNGQTIILTPIGGSKENTKNVNK